MRKRAVGAAALALGVLVSGTLASADGSEVLELELRLFGALGDAGSLTMDLTRTGDRWERAWAGDTESRKIHLFTGRVAKAEITERRVALSLDMRLAALAQVQIDLVRGPDGRLEGTYGLTSRRGKIEGKADGRIKPRRPPLPQGFVPPKPGEHPRILFRSSELPALKRKLETPLGQALFRRMGGAKEIDAIGMGLKYRLTGQREFAEQARAATAEHITGKGAGYSMRTAWGRLPEQIAVAYDLCYDAWPADFKRQVEDHLVSTADTYFSGRGMSGGINWHVCSNWAARIYAGAAFIGLALWGEKGPMPPTPADGPDAQAELRLWEADAADWTRLGQASQDFQLLFERGRYLMYRHCREAAGTGGYRGECAHYGLKATEMVLEYAACHRRMFGTDLSPFGDITHVVPRQMFAHYYPEAESAKPVPLNINGLSEIWGNFFAYAYPLTPPSWQGALLWAWNRHLGVAGPDAAAKMIESKGTDEMRTGDPVWLFLSYPLDTKPQHPSEAMPLTWQAPDFGYYGFRNRWKGQGDFILQVYAKAHAVGGWSGPNAGTFRLFGLGQSWNEDPSSREICAWQTNRVMMPEDEIAADACGRVTHVETRPDGSGTLSIDLSDVYSGKADVFGGLYSKHGNLRHEGAFKDIGIRALRAIGVAYSGRCGAPCLFALVDRIQGGKSKIWTWDLGDEAVVGKVTVVGNTFTLPRGEGVLRGTFVAPAKAQVTAKVHDVSVAARGGRAASLKIPSLHALGGEEFLLVATVQDSKAALPEVKVEGSGLAAKVTVGQRVVRFANDRIVLDE